MTIRLDKFLVDNNLVKSRARWLEMIKDSKVTVNWKITTKASLKVNSEDKIELIWEDLKWVSRWWLKLEKAISEFKIDLNWKKCLDIWASTGWFTHVMLENWAKKVYALDVWHSQLVDEIKNNDKVISIEKTNARYLTEESLPEKIDFISIDVSFISLELILWPTKNVLKEGWSLCALIKPQFEVWPTKLNSNWIVKNPKYHDEARRKIISFAEILGYKLVWITYSPVKWWDWNKEFLVYFQN